MLFPSLQATQMTSSSYQDGSPYPYYCRRRDISYEQSVWTFMPAIYAKWYSFTPPARPNFPPPLIDAVAHRLGYSLPEALLQGAVNVLAGGAGALGDGP